MIMPSNDVAQNFLNQKQIESFDEKGFLIADFGFNPVDLDTIVSSLYRHFEIDPVSPARVQDAWKFIDEVRRIAVNSNVRNSLQQLYGREAKPFQTLNFPIGTEQKPHSDTIHFNTEPQGFMAGVWVALEDIDRDNGPLIYYPGSHKLAEYTMQDFGLNPTVTSYPDYEKAIQRLLEEENIEPHYATIKKGEALIWHANLLHGGAPRLDMNRSRYSQVTHYFFADCKYYTPMLGAKAKTTLRLHQWIPIDKPYSKLRNLTSLQGIRTLLSRLKR